MTRAALVAVSLALASCGGDHPQPPPTPKPSRVEFLAKCGERFTDGQCRNAFGPPTRTSSGSKGDFVWYYDGATIDPTTGKVDRMVQVVFNDRGYVERVNFY